MSNNLNKIVIDCQLLQTTAWNRGMGKYCSNLLSSLSKQQSNTKFILIFNKNIPTPRERRELICKSIHNSERVDLSLSYLTEVKQGRALNKATLNKFMKERFGEEKVQFLMLSNFTFDYVATFPDHSYKSILLYDLIPLAKWDSFKDMFAPVTYFEHFRDFAESDIIFSISESAKQDAVKFLGLPDSKVINVGGANIPRNNSSEAISPDIKNILQERFVMFPSADFAHKNNENMAIGFKNFNQQFGGQFKLIITSNFSKSTEYRIKSLSPNIIFTGNVSDAEYQELLEKCEAVAFVSTAEGLGLPLLEAISASKPVVASSIRPHLEISKNAFYYCDATEVKSISESLLGALCKDKWEEKLVEYSAIKRERTWDESAKKLFTGLLKVEDLQQLEEPVAPKTTIELHLDQPKDSEECMKIQRFITAKMTRDHKLHVLTTQKDTDAPLYLEYLDAPTKSIKYPPGDIKEIHILSDATELYSITKAALSDGIVILNLKPKDLLSYLQKKSYLNKQSEADEITLTKVFNKNKLYAFIDLPKQFNYIKKAEDLLL
jgi:glycosyltransferase involved in cell wall biosynthesis